MQIIKNSLDTSAGRSDWFTGAVYIDTITVPSNDWRIDGSATFTTTASKVITKNPSTAAVSVIVALWAP